MPHKMRHNDIRILTHGKITKQIKRNENDGQSFSCRTIVFFSVAANNTENIYCSCKISWMIVNMFKNNEFRSFSKASFVVSNDGMSVHRVNLHTVYLHSDVCLKCHPACTMERALKRRAKKAHKRAHSTLTYYSERHVCVCSWKS